MASRKPIPPSQLPGQSDDEALVLDRLTLRTQPPPMYQVVMLNDDYTPMEFVVAVLQDLFGKDLDAATQIMLKIHTEGRGICGVYPKDIAQTKVEMVLQAAHRDGHPLQCICEPTQGS